MVPKFWERRNQESETGVRKRESGNRSQDSGVRIQDTGVRRQGQGIRRQESGSRKQESGSRNQEAGKTVARCQLPIPNCQFKRQDQGMRNQETKRKKMSKALETGNAYVRGGKRLIGHDNAEGKGHHKHVGNVETLDSFENVDRLIEDFLADVGELRRGGT